MTTVAGVVGAALQVAVIAAGGPLLVGVMRQVRARLEGRVGAGVLQPWRDLRKLLVKQNVTPEGTTAVFALAPAVLAGTTLVIAAIGPFVTTASPLDQAGDLFTVVGLLLLGTVALALAAIDTGTAFGGMGASRALTIAALAEPTILLAVFALSLPARSSNLAAIATGTIHHPGSVATPSSLLALVALVIVVLAEAGRLPVDNPSTHLELTMVHEAMLLEYAGPRLAVLEWASSARLTILLALLANLFVPWGVAGAHAGVGAVSLAVVCLGAKVAAIGAVLALGEVWLAKLRLFRVPELLAGSFLIGLLSVTSAFFLHPTAIG